jgi:TIR domain
MRSRDANVRRDATEVRPPSALRGIRSRVLGFDAFISYRHQTAKDYAYGLAGALKITFGWACFLDRTESEQIELTSAIRSALNRSRMLIVIAEPGILESRWVPQEIEIFRKLGKPIVPVSIGGFLAQQGPLPGGIEPLRAWPWVDEADSAWQAGVASAEVLAQLRRSRRGLETRTWARVLTGLVIVTLSAATIWALRERSTALANELEALRNNLRLTVANGARAMRDGDLGAAWLWFADALKQTPQTQWPETPQRIRLAAISANLPWLEAAWFPDTRGTMEILFHPDGQTVLTVDVNRQGSTALLFWNPSKMQPVREFKLAVERPTKIAFSADQHQIITANNVEAGSQDLATGAETFHFKVPVEGMRILETHSDYVLTLKDRTLQLWHPLAGVHDDSSWSFPEPLIDGAASADGRVIAAIAQNRLYVRSMGSEKRWDFDLGDKDSRQVSVNSAGTHAVVVSYDKVLAWDAADPQRAPNVLIARRGITEFAWDPTGTRLAVTVAGADDTLETTIIDVASGTQLGSIAHELAQERWSSNRRLLASLQAAQRRLEGLLPILFAVWCASARTACRSPRKAKPSA